MSRFWSAGSPALWPGFQRKAATPPGPSLGPELVINGTFTGDDTTGYTNTRNTNVSSNQLNATGGLTPAASLALTVVTEAGKTYRLVYDLVAYSAGNGSRFSLSGADSTLRTTPGSYTENLTPSGANSTIAFGTGGTGGICSVDNISLKEVLP